MKAYAKANADAFIQKESTPTKPLPQFVDSTPGGKAKEQKMSLSEMMKAKNDNPDFVVNFE